MAKHMKQPRTNVLPLTTYRTPAREARMVLLCFLPSLRLSVLSAFLAQPACPVECAVYGRLSPSLTDTFKAVA